MGCKKRPEKLYERRDACSLKPIDNGSDELVPCTRLEWMLDQGKGSFRVSHMMSRTIETMRLGVVIDLSARAWSECVWCPFCGVKIETRFPTARPSATTDAEVTR